MTGTNEFQMLFAARAFHFVVIRHTPREQAPAIAAYVRRNSG